MNDSGDISPSLKYIKISVEYYHKSNQPDRIYYRETHYDVDERKIIETKELGYVELKQEEQS